MITLTLNGLDVQAEEGTTLIEVAQFYGFPIPTLCRNEGLTNWGGCRLCIVELVEGERSRVVSSCTYPAQEGLVVRTNSEKVLKIRKTIIETMLATVPTSKIVQDLASKYGVHRVRVKVEHKDCLLCGLCTRMCTEQMDGAAIGLVGRGENFKISTAFDKKSETCRLCGGCIYICPACQIRCIGPNVEADGAICNACANLDPPCVNYFDDVMCYMDPCVACEQAAERIPKYKNNEINNKESCNAIIN
ncbi:MAG: (2Fe-2S)-binding protein [bacterium]|nr:MAG: (2Fe-2S)-binding protein [bacterium]